MFEELKNFNVEELTGPQQYMLMLMIRFAKEYNAHGQKANPAVASYSEEDYGERFALPCYNGMAPIQPAEHALRYRVWHKSKDPDNPGSSRYEEYEAIGEALAGYHELCEEGYICVDWPIGVGWDNAMGCFVEFQVQELLDIKKGFLEGEEE